MDEIIKKESNTNKAIGMGAFLVGTIVGVQTAHNIPSPPAKSLELMIQNHPFQYIGSMATFVIATNTIAGATYSTIKDLGTALKKLYKKHSKLDDQPAIKDLGTALKKLYKKHSKLDDQPAINSQETTKQHPKLSGKGAAIGGVMSTIGFGIGYTIGYLTR